jgi:hypothetical protein
MSTKWQTMMMVMMISAKIGEELCGTQKYDFHNYVSVDRNVATSGVSTFEEICEAYGSTRSVEEKNKEGENEEDMVLSFAKTYKTLEKVKSVFLCAQCN